MTSSQYVSPLRCVCSSDTRCIAYTFLSTPVSPGVPTCWLKSSVGGSSAMETASSGVRVGLDGPTGFLYGVIRGTSEAAITRMGSATYAKIRGHPPAAARRGCRLLGPLSTRADYRGRIRRSPSRINS